ncbi:hypothetical protein ATCC90586_000511 [Pythium insidiosum]|nr:hypothetical protein ATCC90586_000511 [Pythium insidiosum]
MASSQDGGGDVVSDEELRLLEAMASMSQSVMQLNHVLTKLNRQTVELATEMRTAERQMSALYLPFQAAIYQLQSQKRKQQPAASEMDHAVTGTRTEL